MSTLCQEFGRKQKKILNISRRVTFSVFFTDSPIWNMSPISTHPDLDLIEDNDAKRTLLSSTMFWGTAGSLFGIHDEPDKYGSVNYLHPIDGTHPKYWVGFTIADSFKIKAYFKTR